MNKIQQWHLARNISKRIHEGQKDKAGEEYFLHVKRVSAPFRQASNEQIVAFLHDVIEDSNLTIEDLYAFDEGIVLAVDAMTRRGNESYQDYIVRCGENSIARVVKMEDLKDNMNMARLPEITDDDIARLRKYHKAYWYLYDKQNDGKRPDLTGVGHWDPCGPKGVNANDIFPYRCEKEHCSEQQIELCSKVEIEGYEISDNCLFKEKYTD